MIRNSLFFRLMGAFALVILAGVVVVTFIANQTTTNEFQQYMFRGQMVQLGELAGELANYYRARGSWEGVDNALRDVSNSMMGGAPNNGAMMGAPNNGAMGMSSGGLWLAVTMTPAAASRARTSNAVVGVGCGDAARCTRRPWCTNTAAASSAKRREFLRPS